MNKKRLLAILLCVMLVSAMLTTSFQAFYHYTYTVTLYAGNHATFADGSEVMTFSGLEYGTIFDRFNAVLANEVALEKNSKYYVKGVRLSGRDNNTVSNAAFRVTADAEYVVAYGIKGEMVQYTVQFLDANGEELAPPQSYYGNVGDKPVVAFLYIEGYEPQAYNLTKTLSANAAENVFPFEYTPIVVPTPEPPAENPPENPTQQPETENPQENPTQPGEENPPQPENPPIAPPDNPNGNENVPPNENPNGEEIPDNNTPNNGPQDILDIDEPDTPLAGPDQPGTNEEAGGLSAVAIAGIVGAGAVSLFIPLVVLRRKKRKKSATV